jgi:hypothetical protein
MHDWPKVTCSEMARIGKWHVMIRAQTEILECHLGWRLRSADNRTHMPTLPPLAIPVMIIMAVAMGGAVVAFLRDRQRFSGYRDITKEVLRLGKAMNGEVFRDGEDLVVNGAWQGFPVQVRFSNAQNTPGFYVRMGARACFTLFIYPRSANAPEGRHLVRTTDEKFNARLQARSNEPTLAQLFLGNREVPSLQKLCHSSSSFLRITMGAAELFEMKPPAITTVRNVTVQLGALATLAMRLAEMPGADAVVVEPLKRERRYLLRTAIAAGLVATIAAVTIAMNWSSAEVATRPSPVSVAEGVRPAEAAKIPGYQKWRVAGAAIFDPDAVAWLRANGLSPAGRIPVDFSGTGKDADVAYLLAQPGGSRRVVILSHGENIYDNRFPYLGAAARVRKSIIDTVQWVGAAPLNPDGDGLLIVRAPNDRTSGLVIFSRGERIISATPKDYQTIRLE